MCKMAVVTARSNGISILLSLMLALCILSIEKRAFVTSDVIGLSLKFVEDSSQESYVFSSLYAARVKGCSLNRSRNLVCMLLILSGDVEICPGPESMSREEFIHFLSRRGLKMQVHQNIQGLRKNFDLIQEFITTHKDIDILSMSETHLIQTILCLNYRDICFIKEIERTVLAEELGYMLKKV